MNKRVRLTKRAADMSIPYPGNVNQPDRKDPDMEQYHTFEQQVNHELPDMRHEWQEDTRDDIGFGIPAGQKTATRPNVASAKMAANKAVKLAVLLLGEKVPENVIEQQARDFLHIGSEAMDRTLARFASTQALYAAEEEKKEEKVEEPKAEEVKKAAEVDTTVPPTLQTPANPQEADKAASAKKAEEVPAAPAVAPAAPAEKPVEAAAKKAEETDLPVEDKAPADMDIELQSSEEDMEEDADADADAKLASLFQGADEFAPEEEEAETVEASAKTAKKAGISRLGGQPKVASESGDHQNLSNLWSSAPDVSEAFR